MTIFINRWHGCSISPASWRRQTDCGGDLPGWSRFTPREVARRAAEARGTDGDARLARAEMTMLMAFRSIALFLMIALIAADPRLAAAQRVVGGHARLPEVEVDLSVLDSLGPAPTLPDLLRGQPRSNRSSAASSGPRTPQQAAVHAPRQKKKRKATAHAGSQRAKTVASAAERASPPVKPVASENGTAARHNVTATPLHDAATSPPPSPPLPELPTPAPPPPAPTLPPAATPAPAPVAPAASANNVAPAAAPPAVPTSPANNAGAASGEKLAAATPPPAAAASATAPPSATAAATAPPVVTAIGDRTVRVQFPAGAADVPDGAKRDLDGLAQKLASNEQARLQLVAYAAGGADEANQARRLSLSRALAVRTYLIAQGVPNSRMDVRALGNRSDGAPADRVDIVMLER
jgi:outer membrane protein OmpA-like peptidoglycan-associated protein